MYDLIITLLQTAQQESWSQERIKSELSSLLTGTNLTEQQKQAVMNQYAGLGEFLGNNTELDTGALSESISKLSSQFALVRNRVNNSITNAVLKHINDLSGKALRQELKHQLGTLNYYAETIRRTAVQGVSAAKQNDKALKNGIKYFKYVGPSAERGFCKKHLGKTYTYDEIKLMNNGQGLDVFAFKGGWNCRHKWMPVAGEVKQVKPKVEKQPKVPKKPIEKPIPEPPKIPTPEPPKPVIPKPVKEPKAPKAPKAAAKKYTEQNYDIKDYQSPKALYGDDPYNLNYRDFNKTEIGSKMVNYRNNMTDDTTYALEDYMTNNWIEVNEALRTGKTHETYDQMKKGDMSFELEQDTVMYRGMKFTGDAEKWLEPALEELKAGKTTQLSSFSLSHDIATNFASMNYGGVNSIMVRAKAKKGTKMGVGTDEEKEFILDKDVKFNVTNISKYTGVKDGKEYTKYFVDIDF